MTLQRYGRIINISSIMTRLHEPGTSVYASCKAAVEEITKVLAREALPLGITCNSIALSTAETESSLSFGEEWMKKILEKQTLKRLITVEEICSVISFFESDTSSCITGQVLCMGLVS
jgi:3-oxoacyl-[acyl-carrier protein] reductase